MERVKVFVDVTAVFFKEGVLIPKSTIWKDGRENYLFYEDNNLWFVEGKVGA